MNTNLRNYGDVQNLQKDSKLIKEIMDKQGFHFIVDVIADKIGEYANKFNLSEEESIKVKNSIVDDLNESIKERI